MLSHRSPSIWIWNWLLLGIALAIPVVAIVNRIALAIYPSTLDDMGLAFVKRLQFALDVLIALSLFLPGILLARDVARSERIGDAGEGIGGRLLSLLSRSAPTTTAMPIDATSRTLISMSVASIISVAYYLFVRGFDALRASVDFLLGNPGLPLVGAYAIVSLNYILVICILVCSFLLLDTSIGRIFGRIGLPTGSNRQSRVRALLVSWVVRILLGVLSLWAVHFSINYTGRLSDVVSEMIRVSLILASTVAVCLLPLFYSAAAAKSAD